MPCPHKFQNYLNLERLDFAPTTLIVGTFNPTWPAANTAPWFYGRTANNYFWDVLPRIIQPPQNLREDTHEQWKDWCSDHKVALTDIISCIEDADINNPDHQAYLGNYRDRDIANHFREFAFTDLVALLQQHPTIQNVYLTRQTGIPLFDTRWAAVEAYGLANGLHVRKLLTPSANARFRMGNYVAAHPDDQTPLRNFIYQEWLAQWH